MWSFVGKKREKWWVWVALDADSRQVVGMAVGDRSEATARRLWKSVPRDYRDGATIDTDAVLAFARARLAAYKTPREIILVDALPRTTNGKLKRKELAALRR